MGEVVSRGKTMALAKDRPDVDEYLMKGFRGEYLMKGFRGLQ